MSSSEKMEVRSDSMAGLKTIDPVFDWELDIASFHICDLGWLGMDKECFPNLVLSISRDRILAVEFQLLTEDVPMLVMVSVFCDSDDGQQFFCCDSFSVESMACCEPLASDLVSIWPSVSEIPMTVPRNPNIGMAHDMIRTSP